MTAKTKRRIKTILVVVIMLLILVADACVFYACHLGLEEIKEWNKVRQYSAKETEVLEETEAQEKDAKKTLKEEIEKLKEILEK